MTVLSRDENPFEDMLFVDTASPFPLIHFLDAAVYRRKYPSAVLASLMWIEQDTGFEFVFFSAVAELLVLVVEKGFV